MSNYLFDEMVLGHTAKRTIRATDGTDPVVMDENWLAAATVTKDKVGGTVVVNLEGSIADGAAVFEFDTSAAGWSEGIFFYDIRLTDDGGEDYWSQIVRLDVTARNTPPSS